MITPEQKHTYKELEKQQKDLLKKVRKKSKWTNRIIIIIGAIVGFFLGLLGGIIEDKGIIKSDSYIWYLCLGLLIYLVCVVVHIIIHEAGHLVFGLLTGYKFLSFRIFSITFIKIDGRIQRKKYSIKGTAGQCILIPPERNEDGSFPFLLYNLGGGLANIIVSIPFIMAAALTDNAVLSTVFIAFSLSGIILGATNLIPMDLGVQNDGMNIKGMLKYRYLQDSFYLQLKVYKEMCKGKLITEYDPEIFALPDDKADRYTLTAFNYLYSYYRLLAEHDFDGAYEYLMELVDKAERFPISMLNSLQAEQLFFMVLHHRPVEEIAALYKYVRVVLKYTKNIIVYQRINYVYEALLSEDEKKDIMTLILNKSPKKWKECDFKKLRENVENTANTYPVTGEAKMHLDIINYYCQLKNTGQENI